MNDAGDGIAFSVIWYPTLCDSEPWYILSYFPVSNINCTLVGIKIVDHSDVVGASPVVQIWRPL